MTYITWNYPHSQVQRCVDIEQFLLYAEKKMFLRKIFQFLTHKNNSHSYSLEGPLFISIL